MSEYLLTLKIRFEAMDDVDARIMARKFLEESGLSENEKLEKKLQRIKKDSPPEGLQM